LFQTDVLNARIKHLFETIKLFLMH